MSPYILPQGNVQISFSGGRTSAFMLHQILEANGSLPDRCEVVFTNTGLERPETYDFVRQVGARWSVPIRWAEFRPESPYFEEVGPNSYASRGEPMIALVLHEAQLPNVAQRSCTKRLKIRTANHLLRGLGWTTWTAAVGFRADEAHRAGPGLSTIHQWTPLIDAFVTKHDVRSFWRAQPFDLQTEDSNCLGCPLKSEELRALAVVEERWAPEIWRWLEDEVSRLRGKPHTARKGISWRELIDTVDRLGDLANRPGIFCQVSDGECTG